MQAAPKGAAFFAPMRVADARGRCTCLHAHLTTGVDCGDTIDGDTIDGDTIDGDQQLFRIFDPD